MGRRGRALWLPHVPSLPSDGVGASEERPVREPGLCQQEEKQSNMGGGLRKGHNPRQEGWLASPAETR